MSLLGDLPSFSSSRSKPSSPSSTKNFNSTLDSLLGDSSDDHVASKLSGASARKTESKGPRRNAPNGKRSSDLDFYSTLAMDAIEEEVEPDPVLSVEDSKKMANSGKGIDDMEASVFGDLGRKMSTSSRKNSHSSLSEKVQKVSMSV
jgi:hypothetical protein